MPLTVVALILLASAVCTQVAPALVTRGLGLRPKDSGELAGSKPTEALASQSRWDVSLLIVTGLTIAAYAGIVRWMPDAWTRISETSRWNPQFGYYLLLMTYPLPPALLAWCIASYWIFRFRLRLLWGVVLLSAILGFPSSCLIAGHWSKPISLDFRN